MEFTRKLFTAALVILFIFLSLSFPILWQRPSASEAEFQLQEAKRLSWLGNWEAAGPFFERAKNLYGAAGDQREEAYARIGRIRAHAEGSSLTEMSKLLGRELGHPLLRTDLRLRLWCLMAKASLDFNIDSATAKQAWVEALDLANTVSEKEWAARATGELGIIAFLEGNTSLAVSNVGKAIRSAYLTRDI